jgi:hypothetical protein
MSCVFSPPPNMSLVEYNVDPAYEYKLVLIIIVVSAISPVKTQQFILFRV